MLFRSFLFLDPWSNLISASESFSNSTWTREPGLGLSEGADDPEGRPRATQLTNTSGALQSLAQSIAVPAWFHYSFSVFARSALPAQVRLIVSTDGAFVERLFELTSEWQRYSIFSAMNSTNDAMEVSVQLPAGTMIELFGAQLEAQPAPSQYQQTLLRTGRYAEARFAADSLTQVSISPSLHSTVLRIFSRVTADA